MIEGNNNIQYDDESKKILYIGNITSSVFYAHVFKALREHYRRNGVAVSPIFSFVYVERFDPLVVPNLISLGFILYSIHNKPIQLEIANTNATKFLDNGWFFKAVGKNMVFGEEFTDELGIRQIIKQETGYEIYDYDPQMLGFYNNEHVNTPYNPDHKVFVYQDESYLYYNKFIQEDVSEEELGLIRSEKYHELIPKIKKRYWNVLKTLNDDNRRIVLDALTEIITNAILYSGSPCSAMLQTKNNETKISISDCGVGFEYSFEKRREKFGREYKIVFNEFNEGDQGKYKNLLYIFETLNYSKEKSVARDNLYTLLEIVLKKKDNRSIDKGTMRIHYNDTQVIMTSNRCSACERFAPKECVKCLLDNYDPTNEASKSNLRFFDSLYRGVHIEVELKFKEDVVC